MPACPFCEQDIESDEALVEHTKMRINLKCKRCDRLFVNYCALGGHLAHAHTALPIRAPDDGKVRTPIEEGETDKHTRPAISSEQEAMESNNEAHSTSAVTGPDDRSKTATVLGNDKVNTAVEGGGTEKHTSIVGLSHQEIKGSNNETYSTSVVTGSEDSPNTASAPGKEISIRPFESGVRAEVQQLEKRDEVMVGHSAQSPLDKGIADSMAFPTCNEPEVTPLTLRVHQVVQGHCYCKECKAFFPNDDAQKVHTDQVHNYTCKECGNVFATSERLQEHQVDYGHCYCKSCNCLFANYGDKVRHSAMVHVYPCGVCKDVFRYPRDLIEHQNSQRHHARCSHCTAKFAWAHETIEHMEQDHTPCKCAYCQYGYKTVEELHEHQKVAINFYCMVCGISFQSDKATELHNDVPHKSVACTKCGRHFLNDKALLVHTTYKLDCPE